MKKTVSLILCLLIFMWATPVYAASRTVSVKIAEFPVTINRIPLGNDYLAWITDNNYYGVKHYAQYPLLFYKDITYVPMTWNLCKLLNLNVFWSEAGGLAISQGDPNQWKDFSYDARNEKNKVKQSASIVGFPVTVNGKPIDNSKEQYPLLLFRDITYFPLTWRFAVNEFGWRYSYSNEDGLRIDADNMVHNWQYANSADLLEFPKLTSDDEAQYDTCIRGDLNIWIEYRPEGHAMSTGKMYISQGGKVTQVGDNDFDRFGLFDPFEGMGRFRVEGDWIYTWYDDGRLEKGLVPAKVNILTKEIILT